MRKNKCSQKWSCLPYAFKTFSIETAPSLYKRVFYAVNMSQAFKEKSNEITTAIFVPMKTLHSCATIRKYCKDALHVTNSVIYNNYTF